MYYHCYLTINGGGHSWFNIELEALLDAVIIPYINKQVVLVNVKGGRGILNLSSVSYVQVYKTEKELPATTEEEKQATIGDIGSGKFKDNECTREIIDRVLQSRKVQDIKSTLQKQFLPTKKQVFVIMKFKDKVLDSAYEGVVKPIVKKHKYIPLRIDEIQDSGKITDQILEEISMSEIVLADLSGERPNCYYEAGFAHAIGKEIIFTIKRGTPIHFDLSTYRFIEWETEQELRQKLKARFQHVTESTTV